MQQPIDFALFALWRKPLTRGSFDKIKPRVFVFAAACLVLGSCASQNSERIGDGRAQLQVERQAEPLNEPASAELSKNQQPLLDDRTLRMLGTAEAQYSAIVANGGWPKIPDGPSFRPDKREPRTALLGHRLIISRDLQAQAKGPSNVIEITRALQRFQSRHGLKPTGIVDLQTLESLNITADVRLAQLRINVARIRELSQSVAQSVRYIIVNVPAFQLEAVEEGQVVRRHRVIVGRIERPTPSVEARIRNINFYPAWHVPESIARLDLIPRLKEEPNYLEREHIRVLTDWSGREIARNEIDWGSPAATQFKFRQDPGPWNALGLIRLDMPNAHAVYMHDTPMKDLFGQRQRAISAGCVRVEEVAKLAAWALSDVPGWNEERIDATLAIGQPINVALRKPIQVHFTYVTAWATANGRVEFRSDLYGHDIVGPLVATYATGTSLSSSHRRSIMSP